MVKAIVAIEDYRFYEHGALDLKGTLRALITNQANNGVVQGGSSITQQLVKLTLLTQAKTKAERAGGDRRHLRAQAQGAALRDRLRAEPLQGLDPRALPQHRLLRRRRLRHPGGRPALLQRERQRAQPARVRDAGRPGEEPHRLRPDQLPRPGARAAQRRARPDGRAQRDPAREGREDQGDEARPATSQPAKNGCLNSRAPFFCDYVAQLAADRPAARRDRRGAAQAAQDRRPDDQDHDRTSPTRTAADNAVAQPRLHAPTRRSARSRWSSPAPATCRRSPSPGRWAAARRPARPTSTTSCPRSSATPPASRPGRRSRRSCSPPRSSRASRSTTTFNSPMSMTLDSADFANCPGGRHFVGTFERVQLDDVAAP